MTVRYSGTPLAKKLGVKAAMTVTTLNAPAEFSATLGPLPDDVVVRSRLRGHSDVVIFFVTQRADLIRRLDQLRAAIEPDGMVWVAWPKKSGPNKSSRIETDISEDVIREVVLPTGLVDVKVCAVDETWSGLKVVIRKALR